MTACVSLFRGINVGGNHKVKMSDLKNLHESLGLREVLPYIQSGNVVFQSDDGDPRQIQGQIETSFEKAFGFHSDVFVRTTDELQEIIEKSPFQSEQSQEPQWVAVMFLATCPDIAAQEDLLKSSVGPEKIFIFGKEMYIYYANGVGRSKLSHTLIEKKLKTSGTGRNWNTVLQLQKLLQR